MRTIFLFLFFLIFEIFLPTNGVAQEKISFSEMVAKRQALQAEQDELGKQWQENQDSLNNLEGQFEILEGRIDEGKFRLEPLREEAETLVRNFNRKLPEIEKQFIDLEDRKGDLELDYNRYSAYCNVTVPDKEIAQRQSECDAWFARYSSAWNFYSQDFTKVEREHQTLEDSTIHAVETHDSLFVEIKEMEAQQQSLADEGLALKNANEEIIQEGWKLDVQIKEFDRLILQQIDVPESPCRPVDFHTAEAFEECMRTIFDGGDGAELRRTIWSPFDLDPSVVKPDWR